MDFYCVKSNYKDDMCWEMNYPVKFLTDIGRTTPNPSDLQRQS